MKHFYSLAIAIAVFLSSIDAFSYTTTSNMSLKTPASGDTDYPTSISDSFTLIDAHDHTSGKGVVIPAGGLASNSVTSAKIVDGTIVADDIASNAISTAKILDANVTNAKLAAPTYAVSSGSGSISTSSTTFAAMTNMTASITGTGRPVVVHFNPLASTTVIGSFTAAGSSDGEVRIKRGSTVICTFALSNSATDFIRFSPSSYSFMDTGASAGSLTYTAEWRVAASGSLSANNVVLIAREL